MFEVSPQVEGAAQAVTELNGVSYRMLHKRPAWEAINVQMAEDGHRTFVTQGASNRSGRWQSASDATVRQRKGRKGLMRRSDDLYRSLAQAHGQGRVFIANDERIVAVGSGIRYAGAHHYGSGRLPARKLLDPTDAQKARYGQTLDRWILTGEVRP